ncbi:hypothetical protein [Solimonas sp. SE-A11]|uniref:hypothetical protein n=1 Tax=Solimonas sp. SE-A11 TaxID=3054954 RepID=UPI00259CCE9C|nr:hypothetical protein [Solimonas sp. SE-A11]MDM4769057.1 hypothetical protein [Solimonas sp. SE-A11]
MAKPYIAVSHFHAPLFTTPGPQGDDYSLDADTTFVVVQPFLLGSNHPDRIDPLDYLIGWDAARLKQEGFGLIDARVAQQLQQGVEAIPVPFPKGTDLSLEFQGVTRSGGAAVSWSDNRTIGGTTPRGTPVTAFDQLGGDGPAGWPGFAVLSQAVPLIDRFDDLDSGAAQGLQKQAVESALLTLFSQLVEAGGAVTPAQPASDVRQALWTRLVAPNYVAHPLSETVWWHEYLHQVDGGETLISWAYRQLIMATAGGPLVGSPTVSVPRFAWEAARLDRQAGLFLDTASLSGRSYLDAMWDSLTEIGKREPQKLTGTLQRLFGFGERLAWPRARVSMSPDHSKRFITLRPSLAADASIPWLDPSSWLVTNMVSLLGQVFRIAPFDPHDPPTGLTAAKLTIAGNELPASADLTGALNKYFTAIARDAVGGGKPQVTVALAHELGDQSDLPSHPERLVLFAAREAKPAPLATHAQPVGRSLVSISEALLDLVDPAARFGSGGRQSLPTASPARRGLRRSELAEPLPQGAVTWQRRLAEITPKSLTGTDEASGPSAYALRFPEALHPAEAEIGNWLAAIAAGDARQTYLWIPTVDEAKTPQPTAVVALSAANLCVDIDGSILLLDSAPAAAGSIAKLLAKRPSLPQGAKDPRVTVVFASQGSAEPFDLIEGIPDDWSLTLANAPASRLGLSSDRLAVALAAHWTPAYDPDSGPSGGVATPLADQVANTNKLRLRLDGPDNSSRKLTPLDALLPLPPYDPGQTFADARERITDRPWHRRGTVTPSGPQAFYWLGEYLDQSGGSDSERENFRYGTWVGAGRPVSLSGYFEHQFGHRVAMPAVPLDMRRAVDIVNPAQVHFGALASIGGPGERIALVSAREVRQGADTKLRIGFRIDAAKHALERYNAKRPNEDFAADVRALYRAVAELRDAVIARQAYIEIEQWAFNNSYAIGAGKGATLAQGLICIDTQTALIDVPAPGTPLARLFSVLDRDFDAFRDKLTEVLGAATGEWWAQLADLQITEAAKRASVLRTGLFLVRPDAVKATSHWAKGAMIAVAEGGAAAGKQVADAAQAELERYLSQSRLTADLNWVFVPEGETNTPVLGTGADTLLVPDAPTDAVERVVDLFYMPHAFILPAAHPALGDRQSSFEFTGFLLTLIEDILAGNTIDDRIQLPVLGAQAAIELRQNLRNMLEKRGGIADQLMAMFRRVDIPAAKPRTAADRRQALHWHAGDLLDKLETLTDNGVPSLERPRTAIRAMIVNKPGLYVSARAIAIVLFNRHVMRVGSDPAALVNQDCFSPELLALDLTKKLVGDDGTENSDTTRFDLSALRGSAADGIIYPYLIDVLPDGVYDDTVVIAQNRYRGIDPDQDDLWGMPRNIDQIQIAAIDTGSGVEARRGEGAIDPPLPSEPAGILANMVHVFPSWRVSERDAQGISRKHAYYLLPERRMPPLARAMSIKRIDGGEASQTPITLDLPEPQSDAPLPRIKLRERWAAAYEAAITGLGAVQTATEGDARPRIYHRIRPAQHPHDPATKALPSAKVAGGEAAGWHLLTTVLANFYFAIDLQKSDAKLVEQIDDDLYEIEVEMWPKSPPSEAPQKTREVEALKDKLLLAFRRARKVHSGDTSGAIPSFADEQELTRGLTNWLIEPPNSDPHCGVRLLTPPSAKVFSEGSPTLVKRFRIGRSAQAGGWQIRSVDSEFASADAEVAGALGSVVGFEILAQTPMGAGEGPAYDAIVTDSERSALVRLSVLDHPFHVTRARMRILRNWIDIDGDDKPDINPDFVLASGYSEWACEGRLPQRVDSALFKAAKIPDQGREVRVVESGVPPEIRMREWIEKIDGGGEFDAGGALPAMLNVKLFVDVDAGGVEQTLWEADWMRHDGFTVSAVVHRTLEDLSVRYGKGGAVFSIPTRDTTTVRQVRNAVPAPQIEQLLDGLLPADILTLEPWTRLTWRDSEGHAVLDIDVPIIFKSR